MLAVGNTMINWPMPNSSGSQDYFGYGFGSAKCLCLSSATMQSCHPYYISGSQFDGRHSPYNFWSPEKGHHRSLQKYICQNYMESKVLCILPEW